jgi:hypothetical protein
MFSEMTARERKEWYVRALLQSEIESVRRRADISYASAQRLVFTKLQKQS